MVRFAQGLLQLLIRQVNSCVGQLVSHSPSSRAGIKYEDTLCRTIATVPPLEHVRSF